MIPYSLIALLILCPPSHLLSFLRDGEGQRERERGKETSQGEASLSASINGTVFSRPSIWQVQTGCEPGAAPHLSVCIPSPLFVNKQINATIFCMLGFMNNLFTKLMCVCGCVLACVWARDGQRRHVNGEARLTSVLIELWEKCKSCTASLS